MHMREVLLLTYGARRERGMCVCGAEREIEREREPGSSEALHFHLR